VVELAGPACSAEPRSADAPRERSLLEAVLQTLTGPMSVDTLVDGDLHGGNVCSIARSHSVTAMVPT